MTDKEKKMLKDSIINIFENFNVLDHTATIGGLKNDILKCIDSLQEEPESEDLEKVVEEIVDPTVLNAYGVKEIANRLRRTMKSNRNQGGITTSKAERYIELVSDENGHLCDQHALRAVEIAREETIKEVCEWLDNHTMLSEKWYIEDLKKNFEDKV